MFFFFFSFIGDVINKRSSQGQGFVKHIMRLIYCFFFKSTYFSFLFTLTINDELISCRIELINRPNDCLRHLDNWSLFLLHSLESRNILTLDFVSLKEGGKWTLGWCVYETSLYYCILYYVNSKTDEKHFCPEEMVPGTYQLAWINTIPGLAIKAYV